MVFPCPGVSACAAPRTNAMPIPAAIIQGVSCCWCSKRVRASVCAEALCKKAKSGIIATSILPPRGRCRYRALLPHPARLRMHHRLSHAARECLSKLGHVGYDSVDPVLVGRVLIRDGVHPLALGALVAAGPLRHSDEEALVRGEAVSWLQIGLQVPILRIVLPRQ